MEQKRRILGRHALAVSISGQNAGATQIYNYDQIREIRLDIENLEVQVLMTYEEAYIRVFDVPFKEKLNEEQLKEAKGRVLKFYNDLITASLKFTPEEIENIKKQQEELQNKIKEAQEKAKEEK
jgi:hypothetical protein